MIINIFNSDNSNIAYIKIQNYQIMGTIAYRILKCKSMVKEAIMGNHAFLTSITVSMNNFFTYTNPIVIQHL